ncbi:putative transcription factor and/or regulators TTF-type(Zn) family [Helianthus annuus]|nr:putative transcription factor and/or regulators TTF-type(Zn) family [Helianthus annuus]
MKKQSLISNIFKRKFQENVDLDPTPSSNIVDDMQVNEVYEDIGPSSNNDIGMQENEDIGPSPSSNNDIGVQENEDIGPSPNITSASTRYKIDLNDLPSDPSDRPPITSYHPNQIDDIRRAYLVKKAFQPRGHDFKWTNYASGRRCFNVKWFNKYHWLEYSTKQEKAYCLCCYLFSESVGNKGGRDTFVSGGFCNWSKPGYLKQHVGLVNSSHNYAVHKCENLLNQKRSYDANEKRRNKEEKIGNRYRLMGSVRSARFCLENSLPFRGHDESEKSLNKGIFLSVLKLISENNPDIGEYTLGKAKKNNKLTAPSIQKEIIDCYAKEVTKMICEEIKDDVFGLLVDESSDASLKEQMAVVVRYVDRLGVVKESLIGIAHVRNTYSLTLKADLSTTI